MITVCSVWVKGQVPFTVDYVFKLRNMVKRHLSLPHVFVCLTDRPRRLPDGVIPVEVPTPPFKGWWAKPRLFDMANRLSGRMLYLDLDTLVVDSLDDVAMFPASFALIPDAGNFQGKDGLAVVKRFNSSVMVWDAGVNYRLFDDWTPAVVKRLHGDQDWIGEQMPDAATMPLEWFPRISELNGNPPRPNARVVLVKKPKNHDAARMFEWFAKAWV